MNTHAAPPSLTFDARIDAPTHGTPAAGARRAFSGVAYSGQVIPGHWAWGDVVFDLASMSLPEKLPALVDHSPGLRAGVIDAFARDDASGLTVSGYLLDNEHGRAIASDSDAGFPFQMSVFIEPASIDSIERGAVTVNGREIQAPVTVFRGGAIREVSFTPTGADKQTSAQVFNLPKGAPQMSTTTQEPKPASAELEAEVARLVAENAALREQFAAQQRADRIRQFAAASGVEDSAVATDVADMLASLNDSVFGFVLAQAKPAKPSAASAPANLFAEDAVGAGAPGSVSLPDYIRNRFGVTK